MHQSQRWKGAIYPTVQAKSTKGGFPAVQATFWETARCGILSLTGAKVIFLFQVKSPYGILRAGLLENYWRAWKYGHALNDGRVSNRVRYAHRDAFASTQRRRRGAVVFVPTFITDRQLCLSPHLKSSPPYTLHSVLQLRRKLEVRPIVVPDKYKHTKVQAIPYDRITLPSYLLYLYVISYTT